MVFTTCCNVEAGSKHQITFNVGVKNLFNEKYAESVVYTAYNDMLNYYPSPERNYFTSIVISF